MEIKRLIRAIYRTFLPPLSRVEQAYFAVAIPMTAISWMIAPQDLLMFPMFSTYILFMFWALLTGSFNFDHPCRKGTPRLPEFDGTTSAMGFYCVYLFFGPVIPLSFLFVLWNVFV